MATGLLGAAACGAPQVCRAAGCGIWCCQREPHLSSEQAAILENIQKVLAGLALHDGDAI